MKKIWLASMLVMVSSPVLAQSITPTDDATAKRAAIEQMLKVAHIEETYQQQMETTVRYLANNMPCKAALPDVRAFLYKYSNYTVVKPQIIDAENQVFTMDEIREITANSPAGKKIATEKQPLIAQKFSDIGTELVNSHRAELDDIVRRYSNADGSCK